MIIYKITNKVNGKSYIGYDSKDRPIESYYGSGKLIKLAVEKYGINNFTKEIIENVEENNWQEREMYWINIHSTIRPNGYNIYKGGTGGDTYKYLNENELKITKNKLSSSRKNKTYEEIYGEEKAKKLKGHFKNKASKAFKHHGKTFEEAYGEERAREIKAKLKNRKSHKDVLIEEYGEKEGLRLFKESYQNRNNKNTYKIEGNIYEGIKSVREKFNISINKFYKQLKNNPNWEQIN